MTQAIYRDVFSPNAKYIPCKVNLGNFIEVAKIEADRFIRTTNKRNFAKKQARVKAIKEARIEAYINRPNMKPFTKFVVTDKEGNEYVNEVKTKIRFNPSREELAERKAKGIKAFCTM